MIVRQAANVLELLEFFAQHGRPATLSEVAEALGWPRSSTFNLIGTLTERGYLYEPRPREGYYPSPRLLDLAQRIAEADPLPEPLIRLVRDLAQEIGETIGIGGPAGLWAVFLHVRESPQPIRYFAHPGMRLPIHLTATGRAILAQYPPADRAALLRRAAFERHSASTPMSVAEVETEIRRAEERGWHQNLSEYSRDLCGIALPLPLGPRRLSLVAGGPLNRMHHEIPLIAARLRRGLDEALRGLG